MGRSICFKSTSFFHSERRNLRNLLPIIRENGSFLLHMNKILNFLFCVILLCLSLSESFAKGTYQEPADFINETFGGDPPAPKKLWIRKEMQTEIQKIMDRRLKTLRLRYWTRSGRFAYVLEEIGKEKPITVGYVVNGGEIERVNVLIFRETRGWEVRYPVFTDQFEGATLKNNLKLDRDIDGISGATLSVRALTKMARLALYLYQHCNNNAERTN